jgi:hydroxyacylglutathione hydrolase
MDVDVRLVPCLADNYAVILRDRATDATAVIDAPDAKAIEKVLDAEGWKLTHILITHHHGDHVQGIPALKKKYGATVVGPHAEATQIPQIDVEVGPADPVAVGGMIARVIETPGHTAGHIVYMFDTEKLLFAGDTLFALGCGRPFERPAPVLWASLLKLRELPGDTKLYCGHEYTLANARFSVTVDPKNKALAKRLNDIEAMRAAGKPTLPSTIAEELRTNPFLRADEPAVAEAVGMKGADPAAVFTELRERKNNFKG